MVRKFGRILDQRTKFWKDFTSFSVHPIRLWISPTIRTTDWLESYKSLNLFTYLSLCLVFLTPVFRWLKSFVSLIPFVSVERKTLTHVFVSGTTTRLFVRTHKSYIHTHVECRICSTHLYLSETILRFIINFYKRLDSEYEPNVL